MKYWFSIGFLFAYFNLFSQNEAVYTINDVSTYPSFKEMVCEAPGTKDCFQEQIQTHVRWNFRYPDTSQTGTVYVQFVIDSTGFVHSIQARSKVSAFEREGIRIISLIPKLEPARKDGQKVSVRYSTPIVFNRVIIDANSIQKDKPKSKKNTSDRIKYFPREQIVLEVCEGEKDTNECLRQYIETSVLNYLNANVKRPNSKKDSLEIDLVFSVDRDNKIIKKPHQMMVQSNFIKEKHIQGLENILISLPQFKVINRKPETYNVRHSFEFLLTFNKDSELPFKVVKRNKYKGGKVVEIPVFPGCNSWPDSDGKKCFQQKMEEHISSNFSYPEEALERKISGRVDVLMTIDKTGKVINIKTQGPHYLLTQEAVRIMKLLPKMEPGRIDGKPTDLPYSIPVTFGI